MNTRGELQESHQSQVNVKVIYIIIPVIGLGIMMNILVLAFREVLDLLNGWLVPEQETVNHIVGFLEAPLLWKRHTNELLMLIAMQGALLGGVLAWVLPRASTEVHDSKLKKRIVDICIFCSGTLTAIVISAIKDLLVNSTASTPVVIVLASGWALILLLTIALGSMSNYSYEAQRRDNEERLKKYKERYRELVETKVRLMEHSWKQGVCTRLRRLPIGKVFSRRGPKQGKSVSWVSSTTAGRLWAEWRTKRPHSLFLTYVLVLLIFGIVTYYLNEESRFYVTHNLIAAIVCMYIIAAVKYFPLTPRLLVWIATVVYWVMLPPLIFAGFTILAGSSGWHWFVDIVAIAILITFFYFTFFRGSGFRLLLLSMAIRTAKRDVKTLEEELRVS